MTPLVANAVGERTALRTVLGTAEAAAATVPEPGDARGGRRRLAARAGGRAVHGAESLPLWLPLPDWAGFNARDDTRRVAAGLARRPLVETLAAALADERRLGLDRPRKAGLSPRAGGELVAAWRVR